MAAKFRTFGTATAQEMKVFFKGLSKAYRPAMSRTLNRITSSQRTAVVKTIRQSYHIKASDVRKEIKHRKSTRQTLTSILSAATRRIRAIKFKRPRATNEGVRVEFRKGRPQLLKGAFFAGFRPGGVAASYVSGNQLSKGVFVHGKGPIRRPIRVSHTTGRRYRTQLPIRQVYGPSVSQLAGAPYVTRALRRVVKERFEREFKNNLRFYAARMGAGRRVK